MIHRFRRFPEVEGRGTTVRLYDAQGLGKRFILSVGPAGLADTFTLPAGATVLADVVLSDGSRVFAAG